jgi:hypothetical protein
MIKIEFMMSTWAAIKLKMLKDNNKECRWEIKEW